MFSGLIGRYTVVIQSHLDNDLSKMLARLQVRESLGRLVEGVNSIDLWRQGVRFDELNHAPEMFAGANIDSI